jgi:predicted transcriptional regulator of viral defense system
VPGSEYEKVLELATDQYGCVTTSQAREGGVSADTLRKIAKRGTLERVSWGVYRVPTFPPSPYAEYMEASLWPAGVHGVVSHESALTLRELSDVSPSAVHITVPDNFRIRRDVPAHLAIHHARLTDDEVTVFEGIPCTIVARTIEDCHRVHVGPALVRQAIEDAEREGFLNPAEAAELRERVLTAAVFTGE